MNFYNIHIFKVTSLEVFFRYFNRDQNGERTNCLALPHSYSFVHQYVQNKCEAAGCLMKKADKIKSVKWFINS